MADIERWIEISAPPEEVFRFVVSQWEASLDFWEEGIEAWTPLTSSPLGPGFQVEYVARTLGIDLRVRMEVRDFDPGRGWSAYSLAGPRVRGDWRFEPASGGTRFTYRLRYGMPPPILGPVLDRAFLEKRWIKAIEASLANLRTRLEAR